MNKKGKEKNNEKKRKEILLGRINPFYNKFKKSKKKKNEKKSAYSVKEKENQSNQNKGNIKKKSLFCISITSHCQALYDKSSSLSARST